jgi:hypothetical protein
MSSTLLTELSRFVAELESKEASARYPIPDEVIHTVRKAKSLEKLLHEIFMQVSGNGGIHLNSIIRREFGIRAELMDHFGQWAPHSKEQFEDQLHDAIDRAEIRAGNQGVFFKGTPGKQEASEALRLLKDMAHGAVKIHFHKNQAGSELYVNIMDKLLQFYALPNTYPEGDHIQLRNLISAERLHAMSGGDEIVTEALRAWTKAWYQSSRRSFLESMEAYPSYEYVRHFLYALSGEQVERLRAEYIRHISEDFKKVKAKPDLHRARGLKNMLEEVLSWTTLG